LPPYTEEIGKIFFKEGNRMRKEFFEGMTVLEVESLAPWAAVIIEVDGGSTAFESNDDYNIWMNQK